MEKDTSAKDLLNALNKKEQGINKSPVKDILQSLKKLLTKVNAREYLDCLNLDSINLAQRHYEDKTILYVWFDLLIELAVHVRQGILCLFPKSCEVAFYPIYF